MDALQELLARESIKELKHRYAHNLDALQFEALIALFTDDAICEFGSYGTWSGIEAIRRGYQIEIDKVRGTEYPFMHAVSSPVIEFTAANHARARWYLIEMGTTPDVTGTPLRLTGVYDDEYVRQNGQWKIRRSRLTFTWPRAAR
jgi:ketosteroid isomerase-like protein